MKRYFIFRVNGIDWAVTDDPKKACEVFDYYKDQGMKHTRTEINSLTTTYKFEFAPYAE